MSLFDVIGFGLLPQRCPPFSGDTPPLSFLDTSHRAGESVETLSDVVGRCFFPGICVQTLLQLTPRKRSIDRCFTCITNDQDTLAE